MLQPNLFVADLLGCIICFSVGHASMIIIDLSGSCREVSKRLCGEVSESHDLMLSTNNRLAATLSTIHVPHARAKDVTLQLHALLSRLRLYVVG